MAEAGGREEYAAKEEERRKWRGGSSVGNLLSVYLAIYLSENGVG
jgi:hypothetical protein